MTTNLTEGTCALVWRCFTLLQVMPKAKQGKAVRAVLEVLEAQSFHAHPPLYITNLNANQPKPLPGLKLKQYNDLHPEEPDQVSKYINFSKCVPTSSKSHPKPRN